MTSGYLHDKSMQQRIWFMAATVYEAVYEENWGLRKLLNVYKAVIYTEEPPSQMRTQLSECHLNSSWK